MKNEYTLITGSSSGIGHDVFKKLISKGHKIITTVRDSSFLEDYIIKFPNQIHYYNLNLENIVEVDAFVTYMLNLEITINNLILAAGKEITKPISLFTIGEIQKLYNINTISNIFLISKLVKHKLFNIERTNVILFSSSSVIEGSIGKAIYASTKGALEGFLNSITKELVTKNFRFNIIRPAIIQTRMTNNYFKKINEDNLNNLMKEYPMNFGNVKDITNLVIFLISNKSSWINGSIIDINGAHLAYK